MQSVWIALSYLLAYLGMNSVSFQNVIPDRAAGFSILWAKFSDLFGRKEVRQLETCFVLSLVMTEA